MEKARRARLKISYDGNDISADLAPFLKAFDYNDVMSGEADDMSITLEDMEELWEGDWLPEKGAVLNASLITDGWRGGGEEELPLGTFEIDEIEITGPPHEVKLKAVSVPDDNNLRAVERSKSWEKTKLSVVASDVAAGAGMSLLYDVPDDPELDRAEQTEESDLAFLMRLCKDQGLALKIAEKQIIIFDEEKYEQQEPVLTLSKSGGLVKSYSIRSKTRDTYSACRVKYKESGKGEAIEYTYKQEGKKGGKTLQVNQQVKDLAEAEKLAKKKLREKNKEEISLSATCMGDIRLAASNTVMLEGFHKFDGKYIITKAGHSVGSGYSVSLEMRRCLV